MEDIDLNKLYEPVLIPSGTFAYGTQPVEGTVCGLAHASDWAKTEVAFELSNPMPIRDVEFELLDEARGESAELLVRSMKDAKCVTDDELAGYAEQIVDLGKALSSESFDVVFAPIRGAVKPTMQLQVLDRFKTKIVWLPFTRGSSGDFEEETVKRIRQVVEDVAGCGREFRAALIDTAIRGDSALKLSELVGRAAKGVGNGGRVDFHLLHDESRRPDRISEIVTEHENLVIGVELHPVPSLIVEDWQAAIGVKVATDDPRLVKLSPTDGRLLVRDSEKVSLIESADLAKYFDVIIGKWVSDEIETEPDAQFLRDVWHQYSEV